jgi:hypothetical protein
MKTTGHLSLGMAFIILPFVYGCQTMRSEATVKIPTTEKPQLSVYEYLVVWSSWANGISTPFRFNDMASLQQLF